MGPRNMETSHHMRPPLPLPWARPALISERVPHPTANDAGSYLLDLLSLDSVTLLQALAVVVAGHRDYEGYGVIESFDEGEVGAQTMIWRPLAPSLDSIAEDGLRFLKKTFV